MERSQKIFASNLIAATPPKLRSTLSASNLHDFQFAAHSLGAFIVPNMIAWIVFSTLKRRIVTGSLCPSGRWILLLVHGFALQCLRAVRVLHVSAETTSVNGAAYEVLTVDAECKTNFPIRFPCTPCWTIPFILTDLRLQIQFASAHFLSATTGERLAQTDRRG